jgi:hypothetical protein
LLKDRVLNLSRRLKPNEFIAKARKIHGDQYDYSKIVYVYANEKVPIICSKHGKFQQSPSKHLAGQGCRKCSFERTGKRCRLSKSDFIKKATSIHGSKYNYDKVYYKNNNTNVIISCPIHGDFQQTPGNHTHKTNPQGCPVCAGRTRWDMSRFLEEAVKTHNGKYDYSKVVFSGLNKKVKILCPLHGEFLQSPAHHISRKQGCPDCAGTKKGTKEKFIQKAQNIHGNKYNYNNVVYKTTHTNVIITCPIHGDFKQTPANHTHRNNPQGCYLCTGRKRWSKNSFVNEATKVHMGEYDYSKIVWRGLKEKVEIICPFHGPFKQLPIVHLKGSGCQRCLSSKGETKIRHILKKKKIGFKEQFSFKNCSNINPLPFDFFIEVNGKKALIEYHGSHHYKPVGFGNKNQKDIAIQYKNVKKRDEIKEKWCLANKLPLLEIPFFDYDNIESLLTDFIKKLLY